MIDFNEYLRSLNEDEENKDYDEPDDWHTFKKGSKNPSGKPHRVNYKGGSYKKWAKENGVIDKVREKDKNQHREKRAKIEALYKSGISKEPKDRTQEEQKAIDIKDKNKNLRLNATKVTSDFKKYVKELIAPIISKNYYGSVASNNGISLINSYKNAYKNIQKSLLTLSNLNEISKLPNDEKDYSQKQKNLIVSLNEKYNNLTGLFDDLVKNGLCSQNKKDDLLNDILKNTEIGKIFDKFINKKDEQTQTNVNTKTSDEKEHKEGKTNTTKETKVVKQEKKEETPVSEEEQIKNNLKKYFSDDLIRQLKAPFRKVLNSRLEKAPDNIKNMYLKYGKTIVIGDANYIPPKPTNPNESPAEAFYSPIKNAIFFNQDERKRDIVSTFFHESAHFIDANVRGTKSLSYTLNGKRVYVPREVSYSSHNGQLFVRSIISDIDNAINKRTRDFLDLDLDDYCEKYEVNKNSPLVQIIARGMAKAQQKFYEQYHFSLPEKNIKAYLSPEGKIDAIKKLLYCEINNCCLSNPVRSIIADIISMGSKGKYFIGGHDLDYCLNGGKSEFTTTEAFAELTETYCSLPDKIKVIEKFFPNAVKSYNDLVNTL